MREMIVVPAVFLTVLLSCTGESPVATANFPAGGRALVPSAIFEARVKANRPKPSDCPNGAFLCGAATIAGYGPAVYSFFLTSLEPVPEACDAPNGSSAAGLYSAVTVFVLAENGMLSLEESGIVCGPGFSLTAPGGRVSFGNPVQGTGEWEVASATGDFSSLVGSGTSAIHSVGAHLTATYSGGLE